MIMSRVCAQLSPKVWAVTFVAASVALFLYFYSVESIGIGSKTDNMNTIHDHGASIRAKRYQDLELPINVTTESHRIRIMEKKIHIKIDQGLESAVFYREAVGLGVTPEEKVPLVLLHGAAFTSQTWVDSNTMQIAASMGHRVIALDLPGGRGSTIGSYHPAKDVEYVTFLDTVLTKLNVKNCVLVSPSKSGLYALPFIFSVAKKVNVLGYIPIAPVGTDKFTKEQYQNIHIPVMIVYGSLDHDLGELSVVNLVQFHNSQTKVILGAGHPAYIDKRAEWNKLLYNFLLFIS